MTARRAAVVGAPFLVFVWACSPTAERVSDLPMSWLPIDSLNADLPDAVRVFAGRNDTLPLRAWYVRIDQGDPSVETRVVVSDDTDRRESMTEFASDRGVCVAVNGGYFEMNLDPAEHAGLLVQDGRVTAPATMSTFRDSLGFRVARAGLGFFADGTMDVAWVISSGDDVLSLESPYPNAPGAPAEANPVTAPWPVRDAIAAGPALIVDDSVRITSDEEVFFGTSIPLTHPRTAAGYTATGELLLLVVDGRQDASRGVTLEELATLMRELGAVEALNLDGGGSTTLVVGGVLLNRPTGGTFQREVMSALVTRCTG